MENRQVQSIMTSPKEPQPIESKQYQIHIHHPCILRIMPTKQQESIPSHANKPIKSSTKHLSNRLKSSRYKTSHLTLTFLNQLTSGISIGMK